MSNILTYTIVLTFLGLPLLGLASTTATVNVLKDGKVVQSGVGALVADETLIVNHLLVAQGNQIQVSDSQTGAVLLGALSAISQETDLALVSVKGLHGTPFTFALEAINPGRKIYLAVAASDLREGTLHSVLPAGDKVHFKHVQHTVPVGDGEFGAPLLNNCRELAGVSHNKKKGMFNARLSPSSTLSVSSQLEILKSFLADNKISITTAAQSCLSEKDQLAMLEKEKQQREATIKKAEKDKEKKDAALEKLRKEKQKKELELEEAKKQSQSKEEELKESEQERMAREDELKKAEEEKLKQEEKLKAIEEQQKQEREQRASEKKKQLTIAIGLGLVFLIFIVITFMLMRKRRAQLQQVEQESKAKKHELSVEKAKYEAVQEELQHASSTFNDILIVGKDEDGVEHRVKITGDTLAQSTEGVVLGRSAQNANFVLNVEGVSREHLKLTLVDGKVIVEDLASFNGTAISGKTLEAGQSTMLNNNDEIRVGTVTGRACFLNQ
jgi:FHA domain